MRFMRTSPPSTSPATFEGTLIVGGSVYFTIKTDPYPADWTVEMTFDCSPWDVLAPTDQPEFSDLGD
jgi:hypothetical protein